MSYGRGYLPTKETDEDKLKVYELYVDGKGIFHYLNEIEPLPFNALIDISTIDLTFITLYGSRVIAPPIERIVKDGVTEDKLKQIASILYGMYNQKWRNLFDIFAEKVDLDSYVSNTTENILDDTTIDHTQAKTATDTNTNEVTGFNTDEWTNSTKNTQAVDDTTKNTGTTSNTKERTTQTRGSLNNRIDDRRKALDLLNQEVLNEIIFKDTIQLVGRLMF
jgi:hypothetical protein